MSKKRRGDDPFADPEWHRHAEHFRTEVLPQIKASATVLTIVPRSKDGDIQLMLQIGAAVLLDKPIVLVVFEKREVPPRLARIADKIIEADLTTDAGKAAAQQRIAEYFKQ